MRWLQFRHGKGYTTRHSMLALAVGFLFVVDFTFLLALGFILSFSLLGVEQFFYVAFELLTPHIIHVGQAFFTFFLLTSPLLPSSFWISNRYEVISVLSGPNHQAIRAQPQRDKAGSGSSIVIFRRIITADRTYVFSAGSLDYCPCVHSLLHITQHQILEPFSGVRS